MRWRICSRRSERRTPPRPDHHRHPIAGYCDNECGIRALGTSMRNFNPIDFILLLFVVGGLPPSTGGCIRRHTLQTGSLPGREENGKPALSQEQQGGYANGLRWEFSVRPGRIRPGEGAMLTVGIRNTADDAIDVSEEIFGHLRIKMRGDGEWQLGFLYGIPSPPRLTSVPGQVLQRRLPVYTSRPPPTASGGRIVCFVADQEGDHAFDLYRGWGVHERLLGSVGLKVFGQDSR